MYIRFFGFQRRPFDLSPDPDFLFLGESHESALAHLQLGIESGKGFVVITGGVGTGKTTILRAMARRLGRSEDVCYLNLPDLEATELLRTILDELGVATNNEDKVALRRMLRDDLVRRERPAILIIDEAHLLSEESLEQVRLLSNVEEPDRKLLQIILAGQVEIKQLLARPRLRPLAQRIEMFYEIRPLGITETRAYIQRRIQIAGNPESVAIDDKAFEEIHHRTGGVPRLINLLAERAFITAYVANSKKITSKIVREAFEDLGEVTQQVMGSARAVELTFEPEVDEGEGTTPARALRKKRAGTKSTEAMSRTPEFRSGAFSNDPIDEDAEGRGKGRWLAPISVASVLLLGAVAFAALRVWGSKPPFAEAKEPAGIESSFPRDMPTGGEVRGSEVGPTGESSSVKVELAGASGENDHHEGERPVETKSEASTNSGVENISSSSMASTKEPAKATGAGENNQQPELAKKEPSSKEGDSKAKVGKDATKAKPKEESGKTKLAEEKPPKDEKTAKSEVQAETSKASDTGVSSANKPKPPPAGSVTELKQTSPSVAVQDHAAAAPASSPPEKPAPSGSSATPSDAMTPTTPEAGTSPPHADPPPQDSESKKAAPSPSRYAIQCGSFREVERARERAASIKGSTGESVRVDPVAMNSGTWYRVLLGTFDSEEAAMATLGKVRSKSQSSVLQVVRIASPESAARRNGSE